MDGWRQRSRGDAGPVVATGGRPCLGQSGLGGVFPETIWVGRCQGTDWRVDRAGGLTVGKLAALRNALETRSLPLDLGVESLPGEPGS